MLLSSRFTCTKSWRTCGHESARTKHIHEVIRLKHLGSSGFKRHFHLYYDKVRLINLQRIHLFIQTLFLLMYPEGISHWSVLLIILNFCIICLCIWIKINKSPYKEMCLNLFVSELKTSGQESYKGKELWDLKKKTKPLIHSLWLRLLYEVNEKPSICKQILTCTPKNQYLTSKRRLITRKLEMTY